jgi:hypothetical protein
LLGETSLGERTLIRLTLTIFKIGPYGTRVLTFSLWVNLSSRGEDLLFAHPFFYTEEVNKGVDIPSRGFKFIRWGPSLPSRVPVYPLGPSLPLGVKFTPGGQV